jgi:SHS2 domain-containing protein
LNRLFVNAARGMFGLMADLEAVEPAIERQVELEEFDRETLLVSWLSELLWFNEENGDVFVRFEITALTPTHLGAVVWGGPVSDQRQIKAVTFHDLAIIETDDGYEVTLVFDV